MEREELNLSKESNNNGVGGNNSKSGVDGFIDRSKVRILLCDNDSNSSEEVFTLLIRCSYQELGLLMLLFLDSILFAREVGNNMRGQFTVVTLDANLDSDLIVIELLLWF
ncbi:hypothetical protein AHAS_Ahas01G0049800 [Arachis hypogaea]